MAMGKAVLASNLPAMREIVRDGESGILFRAGDVKDLVTRATRLLGNPALRAALGELGRRYVLRERDWQRVGRTYAELYEQLVVPPRGAWHLALGAWPGEGSPRLSGVPTGTPTAGEASRVARGSRLGQKRAPSPPSAKRQAPSAGAQRP
jgi:hypothetical protein